MLKGYGFDDCVAVTKDAIKTPIQWKSQASLPAARGNKVHAHVRFEFEVKNAKLYSFWVE